MAQIQPKTLHEFGKLSGVGSHKLAQYGDKFLAEIKAYCQQQSLHPQKTNPVYYARVDNLLSDTESTTLELYEQGFNIEEIAQKRNVKTSTIIQHLSDLIKKNQSIDLNQLIPLERQKKIWQVLDVLGDIALIPIKDYLGESYSFNEIRLVKAKWRWENRKT
jgi:ATP-dependent DNA helicase RecQ